MFRGNDPWFAVLTERSALSRAGTGETPECPTRTDAADLARQIRTLRSWIVRMGGDSGADSVTREEFCRAEFFRALVYNTTDVILTLDGSHRIRYASPSATPLFGTGAVAGTALLDLVHPDDRAAAVRALERAALGRPQSSGADDWQVRQAHGGYRRVEVCCRDLRCDPAVSGLVVTLRDVTQQRRLEHQLTHQALHDSLTGLVNRDVFVKQVRHAATRPRDGGVAAAVFVVDLDDFKVINDTMGHEAGDELLVEVGRRVAATLRSRGTLARVDGDEFAVLIDDVSDPADVARAADAMLAALSEPFTVCQVPVNAMASIGVSTTDDAGNGHELLRQADLALYAAKSAGKGRWLRYQSALHAPIRERLELRARLSQAVADGAFTLLYQPLVTLDSHETVGFEALVRWRHPTQGLLLPAQFIDVAEDSGLIVPIGNWVLERAIATAARWQAGSSRLTSISVNVSARQFRTEGFVDKVRHELAACGLPPECLVLEITESLLLRDDERVWSDLTRLREQGIRVAIDDFGTGYSSLSYLRQMPVDILKIDRSFVHSVATSRSQRALVDGIVRLAHTLGLQVVAEGIERPEEGDALRTMGCQLGQGYLFARPLSEVDAVQRLGNRGTKDGDAARNWFRAGPARAPSAWFGWTARPATTVA